MKDVIAPYEADHQANSSLSKTSVVPQIVQYIPVKKSNQQSTPVPAPASNPIAGTSKPFIEEAADREDKKLDQILKDASSHVETPDKEADKKNNKKLSTRVNKPPLGAVILAVIVAATLSATAFFVFSGKEIL